MTKSRVAKVRPFLDAADRLVSLGVAVHWRHSAVRAGRARLVRVVACVGLLTGLVVAVSAVARIPIAAAATTTSLPTWSAPVLSDRQAPFGDATVIVGVSCVTGGDCFAVDNAGRVLVSSGPTAGTPTWQVTATLYSQAAAAQDSLGGVSTLPAGLYQPVGISCPSEQLCVAVGQEGQVAGSTDPTGGASAWTVSNLNSINASNNYQLTSVSCASVALCVAAGSDGTGGIVFVSTDPTGGVSAWTEEVVDTASTAGGFTSLTGLSCVPAVCVAVDTAGNVITSTDPAGGSSAWTLSNVEGTVQLTSVSCNPALCVAVDGSGDVVTASVGTGGALSAWTVTSLIAPLASGLAPPGNQFTAVSCPAVSLCVAVDSSGTIVTSSDPTGGETAWSQSYYESYASTGGVPVTDINAVSCTTSSLCVAVGTADYAFVSSNPTGGPSDWTENIVDGYNSLQSVSCPAVSLCVAVDDAGNIITSSDPTTAGATWSIVHEYNPFTSVSCPTTTLCVAANDYAFYTSTDPTGGASSWTATTPPTNTALFDVSCPAVTLCVASDQGGDLITSTDPTGGTASWTVTPYATLGVLGEKYVSCPTVGFCVAVSQSNAEEELYSDNPAGEVWQPSFNQSIEQSSHNNNSVTGLDCPSTGLCLATDDEGNLYTTTNPAAGPVDWSGINLDGSTILDGVSCTTNGGLLCVIGDGAGNIFASEDPTSSVGSWSTATNIDGSSMVKAVSCAAVYMCVAVDDMGYTVATSPVAGVAIDIQSSGSGIGGTVVSSPTGIDCPGTCNYEFPAGQTVTLTATPNSASLAGGFTGCTTPATVNPLGTTCTLTTQASQNIVDAYFTEVTASVTVSNAVSQNGSSVVNTVVDGCGSSGAVDYSWSIDGTPYSPSGSPTACSFNYSFADGSHTIALTATDASGTRSSTTTDDISTSPLAGFTWTEQPVPYGDSPATVKVTFDACAESAGLADYSWNFSGAAPAQDGTACQVTVVLPVSVNNNLLTVSLTGTGTLPPQVGGTAPTVTVTGDVSVIAEQEDPTGCQVASVGVDACWRFGLGAFGVTTADPIRAPDFVVMSVGGSVGIAGGSIAEVLTCDGSLYISPGASVTLGVSLPVNGFLGWGYASDPNYPVPPSNQAIDSFVHGAWYNLALDAGVAGMQYIDSSGTIGYEYDTGAVDTLGAQFAYSYGILYQAGDGATSCGAGGVLASQVFQSLMNQTQYTAPPGQTTVDLSGPVTGASLTQAGQGSQVDVESTGWQDGTTVTVIAADPIQLASQASSDTGSSSIDVTIPANLPAGPTTITETGIAPDGSPRTLTETITVTATSSSPPVSHGAVSTTAVSVNPTSITLGSPVSYNATVTGTAGTPSGTVTFTTGTTTLCTATLSATTDIASCNATNAPPGSDTITGTYSGDSAYSGSNGSASLSVTSATTTGLGTGGYREVAGDGGVFSFNAPFYGSMGGKHLDAPVVGIAADPAAGGYWEMASDGGVFSFDTPFYGSMGGQHLDAPIVGMAATPDGGGYWLVGADGGVFAFGDAGFYGSMGGQHLDAPIVGMAADPTTGGYWLTAADGGVFSFKAPFYGSMAGNALNKPVVGMAATPGGGGYWLVGADGGVFSFGGASFYGSMGGRHLDAAVVGGASGA